MSEKKLIVDQKRLTYDGLFDATELYRIINRYFWEKGYDWHEPYNIERTLPTGKDIEIEVRPWKKRSTFAKTIVKIRLFMKNVKEVEIEKEGVKVKLNQGNVQIIFDSYLETDYEHRWEGKGAGVPVFYFIRILFDRYVMRQYMAGYESNVIEEVNQIFNFVKAFLNMYRNIYERPGAPPDILL